MKKFSNKGFTLIELAIVLVVISLIVGAIVEGKGLVDSTKRNAIMADLRKYSQAYEEFLEKYSAKPGDYSQSIVDLPDGNAACYGDGAGYTDDGDWKSYCAWRQLAEAGFIEGSYTGKTETSVPPGPYSNTYYYIGRYHYTYPDGDPTIASAASIALGVGYSYGTNKTSFLTPLQAMSIDKKMDDGEPITGMFYSVSGTNSGFTDCINFTADATFGNDTYELTSKKVSCVIIYFMESPYVEQ